MIESVVSVPRNEVKKIAFITNCAKIKRERYQKICVQFEIDTKYHFPRKMICSRFPCFPFCFGRIRFDITTNRFNADEKKDLNRIQIGGAAAALPCTRCICLFG